MTYYCLKRFCLNFSSCFHDTLHCMRDYEIRNVGHFRVNEAKIADGISPLFFVSRGFPWNISIFPCFPHIIQHFSKKLGKCHIDANSILFFILLYETFNSIRCREKNRHRNFRASEITLSDATTNLWSASITCWVLFSAESHCITSKHHSKTNICIFSKAVYMFCFKPSHELVLAFRIDQL